MRRQLHLALRLLLLLAVRHHASCSRRRWLLHLHARRLLSIRRVGPPLAPLHLVRLRAHAAHWRRRTAARARRQARGSAGRRDLCTDRKATGLGQVLCIKELRLVVSARR